MPEPFKLLINAERIRECGVHLARVWDGFASDRFEQYALRGLDDLELKARAMHVADALELTLPADFATAAQVIEMALGPPGTGDALNFRTTDAGLAGWICWPLGEYIARRGLAHPERGLAALHALTQRFSAEFAIRPFLLQHPTVSYQVLSTWLDDSSAHVRRLVSEGSRPRLPWGLQLKPLIADPSPSLPLLRVLQNDSSAYVRRSVANHLNDIAKDHPGLIAAWLREHLPSANPARRALLRHASRSLIKRGDSAVLSVWGLGGGFQGVAQLKLDRQSVGIGESLSLQVLLRSDAAAAQNLAVDYIVHHAKARGGSSAKVFKGWQLQLAAGEQRALAKTHSFKRITTRSYYPGPHRVELQVNGLVLAGVDFTLTA